MEALDAVDEPGRNWQVFPARHFKELLTGLPAAVYTTDAEGRITFYNEAAARLWGVRPELGKSEFCGSWKIYRPDGTRLPHNECPMAIALRERKPNHGLEAVAERPDGTRVPFMPYPSPIFDEYGRLLGAMNLLVDLTDIKRGEEAQARLAAIVESTDDAIVSKTLEGRITSWNKGAERLFGYTAQEALGRSIMMLIPEDRSSEEAAILDRIRRGKRLGAYETIRRCKDGTLINVLLTISPVLDSTGRVIGASKIARDISGRKRLEEQRELMLREMNHRIKNLFTLTMGMLDASVSSAESARELADAVKGRLFALSKAHDLTLAARRESIEKSSTTLRALVDAITMPHRHGAKERVLFDGPDVPVVGSAVSNLALLLHEFSTNSAKYGALSLPSGWVEVSCSEEGPELHVVWKEQGGPALQGPPVSTGFGSMLATATAQGQFGGDVAYDWARDGLTIRLSLLRHRLSQ